MLLQKYLFVSVLSVHHIQHFKEHRLCSSSYNFQFQCYWIFLWICGDEVLLWQSEAPECVYAYPSLTLQAAIDIVSTEERQIYMCEHEKSTLLHLVPASHTSLII